MKRAAIVILILLAALLVMAYQPPHYVRTLEMQASQGDWQAAWRLARYYGADLSPLRDSRPMERTIPTRARLVRPLQLDGGAASFWLQYGREIVFRAARDNDPDAMVTIALGEMPVGDGSRAMSAHYRREYLVRIMLHPDREYGLSWWAFRTLEKTDSVLAEATRQEAYRSGLLWPSMMRLQQFEESGDWDRWIEEWATALGRPGADARYEWITRIAMARKQAATGNQGSIALLDRIRAYDRAHPGVDLLGT